MNRSIRNALGNYIKELNLKEDKNKACEKINESIELATGGDIKNLLSPSNINTNIVATSAASFHGTWLFKFDEKTVPQKFHENGITKKMVPMMSQTRFFKYGKSFTNGF